MPPAVGNRVPPGEEGHRPGHQRRDEGDHVHHVTRLLVENDVVQRGEPDVEERERRGDGQDRTCRVGVVADAVDALHGVADTRGPVGRHGPIGSGIPDPRT